MKKILLVLVLALCAIVFASCGKNDYKYPSYNDLTTNPNGDYVKLGNLHYTNKDMYYYLLSQYGVDTLNEMIDATLTTRELTADEEESFTKQMNETIYGVEDPSTLTPEEKAAKEETYSQEIKAQGLHYEAQSTVDELYYLNYQKNLFKQYLQALDAYTADIKAEDKANAEDDDDTTVDHFTDANYVSYLTSNYNKAVKALVLDFDSEIQACNELGLVKSNDKWSGDAKAKFTEHNAVECANYEALATISSVIAAKAMTLKAGEYTTYPQGYGSRFYLLYVEEIGNSYKVNGKDYEINATNFELDADGNITKVINEELKAALFDKLCADEFADSTKVENYQAKYWYELRQEKNLHIYYEGLEINYKSAFNAIYSALSITDFEAFKETTEENTSKVATWDGGSVTADELYAKLIARYGVLTTFLLTRNYVVLTSKYNTIYDIETKSIKDQTEYKTILKSDVTDIKEAFEAGNYASSGYPKAYGWDNFLRDYAGVLSEDALLIDLNSTLYETVLEDYMAGLYTIEEADQVKVAVNGNIVTLSSDKWTKEYTVELADAKENIKAEEISVSIIKTAEQAEKCKEYTYTTDDDGNQTADLVKNDYYYHLALTYPTASETVTSLTTYAVDQAVMEEYVNIWNSTFNATVSGVYAYYDKDLDGVKDENNQADATLKAFVDAIWAEAKAIYNANVYNEEEVKNEATDADTIAECLEKAILRYETSNTGKWKAYRNLGIRCEIIEEKGYTNDSDITDELKQAVKEGWAKVIAKSNETGYSSIASQTIDPIYRHVYDSTVKVTTPYDFDGETFVNDNAYYHIVVVSASSKTISGYEEGNKKYLPSLYYYEQNKNKTDSVTISCSNQITAYYSPAITALTADSVVNAKLMTLCNNILVNIEFDSNKEANKAALQELINIAIANATK